MTNTNRRTFITQTGIAAAAALAIVPSLTQSRLTSSAPALPARAPALAEPLAAYIRNAATGEIALFVGTREIIVHDLNLVARLVQAAR
jgi:hypothetical protein